MHGGGGWPATGNTVSSYAIYAVYAVYTVYTQYIRVVKILKYALVPTLCIRHVQADVLCADAVAAGQLADIRNELLAIRYAFSSYIPLLGTLGRW
jgi:hypothetical protein